MKKGDEGKAMERGKHPRHISKKIMVVLIVVTLLSSLPFLNVDYSSADPITDPNGDGTYTTRWHFNEPTHYKGNNTTINGGNVTLDLTDGYWLQNNASDFNGTHYFTENNSDDITLFGNETDLIKGGDFSTIIGDWNFIDSSDGNIIAELNESSGELRHVSAPANNLTQFDGLEKQELPRWWGVGSVPINLENSTNKQEGNTSLRVDINSFTSPGNWIKIYTDGESNWDWSQYDNVSIWALKDSIGTGLNMSIFINNKTENWTSSPQQPVFGWSPDPFKYNVSSAFNGDLSEIDRLGIIFNGNCADTWILVDNITVSRQFFSMDNDAPLWGQSSQDAIVWTKNNDNVIKNEGTASLMLNYTPNTPTSWVRLMRFGSWNLSAYTHLYLQAKTNYSGSGYMMNLTLHNPAEEYHVSENISGDWKYYAFNISSAFGGDLSNIVEIDLTFSGIDVDVLVYIDDLELFKYVDRMEYPYNPSKWQPSGSAPPSLAYDEFNMTNGSYSLKFWWNPFNDLNKKATIFSNLISDKDWSDYNRLKLNATTYDSLNLRMNVSLYNGSNKKDLGSYILTNIWGEYEFDLSAVPSNILSSVNRIELNFTGVDTSTIAWIDDIRLDYYKVFDQFAYIYQNLQKANFTFTDPDHVFLTFNYAILNYSNAIESYVGIWINDNNSWNHTIDDNITMTPNYLDLSSDMSAKGSYNFSIRFYLAVETKDALNFTIRFDNISIMAFNYTSGNYTSQATKIEEGVIWKNFTWNETLENGTDITIQIRRANSSAEIFNAEWSPEFTNPTFQSIEGFNSKYIQYKVNLYTANASRTPIFSGINFTYQKYFKNGYVETYNYNVPQFLNWEEFNASSYEPPGPPSIEYWYSTDFGNNWYPISPSEKVMDSNSNITFRVKFSITDTFITPTLDEINITYRSLSTLDRIEISPNSWTNTTDYTCDFTATGYDEFNNVFSFNVYWNTTDPKGTINPSGRYYPGSPGTHRIYANNSNNSVWSYIEVTISAGRVARINIHPDPLDMHINENRTFYAYGNDSKDNPRGLVIVNWSVSGGIGTITSGPSVSATFTATSYGTNGQVIAEDGSMHVAYTTFFNVINMPPEIMGQIPNQKKDEDHGSWEMNLTTNGSDDMPPSNLKWYITGEDITLYTIKGENSTNHILNFSTVSDAYGCNQVLIWLEDSMGAKVNQTLWINITSVNDPPRFILQPPDQNVKAGEGSTIDYSQYVNDTDNTHDELTIVVEGEYAKYVSVDGLNVTFIFPREMVNQNIDLVLKITDGQYEDEVSIEISILPSSSPSGWNTGRDVIVPVGLGILALLAVLASLFIAVPLMRKRKQKYAVEDIFLVHKDGRLIVHNTRQLNADRDEDILSGMLTAVQAFIKDSMGKDEVLKEFNFEKKKVMIERGEYVYIAAFLTDEEPANAREQLTAFVGDVEEAYKYILPQWTGEVEAFRGINDLTNRLFVGRGYTRGYWKKLKFIR